jgi:hypothetical protein
MWVAFIIAVISLGYGYKIGYDEAKEETRKYHTPPTTDLNATAPPADSLNLK